MTTIGYASTIGYAVLRKRIEDTRKDIHDLEQKLGEREAQLEKLLGQRDELDRGKA